MPSIVILFVVAAIMVPCGTFYGIVFHLMLNEESKDVESESEKNTNENSNKVNKNEILVLNFK